MAKMIKNTIPVFLVVLLWLCPGLLQAQNEIAREQSSLKGLQAVGLIVNYEANAPLNTQGEIKAASFREMANQTLKQAQIPLISDKKIEQVGQVPILRMHINAMDAGKGLIPFTVSLHLYQPVKLTLNRDIRTSASTWESSTLGITSYNRLHLITNAAQGLLNEFTNDFVDVNSREL